MINKIIVTHFPRLGSKSSQKDNTNTPVCKIGVWGVCAILRVSVYPCTCMDTCTWIQDLENVA